MSAAEQAVLAALEPVGVLPVVVVDDAAVVGDLCAALLEGGISCIEITFRTDAAIDALARATEVKGMLVGAGTVLTVEQARAAADAGAAFAVAPGTDDDSRRRLCRRIGCPSSRGSRLRPSSGTQCGSAARTVKVFPASTLGGPAFLRAISATFPQVRFIPTGGIDARISRLRISRSRPWSRAAAAGSASEHSFARVASTRSRHVRAPLPEAVR